MAENNKLYSRQAYCNQTNASVSARHGLVLSSASLPDSERACAGKDRQLEYPLIDIKYSLVLKKRVTWVLLGGRQENVAKASLPQ